MKRVNLLILVVLAMSVLLINSACTAKDGFDIRDGVWKFELTDSEGNTVNIIYGFTGGKNSGNVTWEATVIGTFAVIRSDVSIAVTHTTSDDAQYYISYIGIFDKINLITGTYTRHNPDETTITGTFQATY